MSTKDLGPEIEYCLVCEGVRREHDGKLTIVGFIGMLPGSFGVSDFTTSLDMDLLFLGRPGSTDVDVTLRLATEDGEVLDESDPFTIHASDKQRVRLAAEFSHEFPGPGTYVISLCEVEDDPLYETTLILREP